MVSFLLEILSNTVEYFMLACFCTHLILLYPLVHHVIAICERGASLLAQLYVHDFVTADGRRRIVMPAASYSLLFSYDFIPLNYARSLTSRFRYELGIFIRICGNDTRRRLVD